MTQKHPPIGQGKTGYKPEEHSRIGKDLLDKIDFKELRADIFSDIARETAEKVKVLGSKNKRTQLRRFYDELIMWNDSVQQAPDREQSGQAPSEARAAKYADLEPFIKMLKAKVVYARGRDHVDKTFETLFSHCIDRVDSPKTLKHCKIFMEAFMGFYRALEK